MKPLVQADKVDLLLAVDNSSSMADKQAFLAEAIPDLVSRLVNPFCVDAAGVRAAQQPTSPLDSCPANTTREFQPIRDMNIGIVDSSMGGDGSDACADNAPNRNNNDQGHLVTRGPTGPVATFQDKGFLAWDAENARGGITDSAALVASLKELVLGAGQVGCGYEQQLESFTRFLVDPAPYATLEKGSGAIPPVTPTGVDQVLLQQRADFVRPDSLVAVVMLTDENDCSTNTLGPQDYAVLNGAPFFRASSACATNPNDKCCYSCGLVAPPGCTADPNCQASPKLKPAEDAVNLKCWDQKKRYGFDGLFPVQRYINALSQPQIDPTQADLHVTDGAEHVVGNPLFAQRDPGLVYFMAIVGVPYQAIATNPTDVGQGLNDTATLTQNGFFSQYVGDPDTHVDPSQPIMIEDYRNRGVAPGAPNGGDRSINQSTPTDLQYACVFDLPQANPSGPDCTTGTEPDNPLCSSGAEPQIKAKAYPGLRELRVVEGLQEQGVVDSICPQTSTDKRSPSYGYRPGVDALVERMKARLKH